MLKRTPEEFVFQVPLPRRFPNAKVGANAPCPCGSGRKFKKCCRDVVLEPITVVPPAVVAEADRAFRRHQTRIDSHKTNFGHVREAVHTTFRGRKVVAVGGTLMSRAPGRNWLTFHDFLIDYVKGCFGDPWRVIEKAKPPNEQHPTYRMFEGLAAFSRAHHTDGPGIVKKAAWTGDVASILTLAYDLFTVADNATLQGRLLRRLRHSDQYQGARYELFAIATCVRAGFSVEYEDETDPAKKHVELIATHRKTGLKIAVEAKSRHRDGVLAFTSPTPKSPVADEYRAGIRRLLTNAAAKMPAMPFVVFVDVNLPDPPPNAPEGPLWLQEVNEETLPRLPESERRKVNLIICTNITFHRLADRAPSGTTFFSVHHCIDPEYVCDRAVLDGLANASSLFQGVPHEFPGEPIPNPE